MKIKINLEISKDKVEEIIEENYPELMDTDEKERLINELHGYVENIVLEFDGKKKELKLVKED